MAASPNHCCAPRRMVSVPSSAATTVLPPALISRPSSTVSGVGSLLGATATRRQPNAGTFSTTTSRSIGAACVITWKRVWSCDATSRAGVPSTVKPGWTSPASIAGWRSWTSPARRSGGKPSRGMRTTSVRGCGDGLKTATSTRSDHLVRRSGPRPASRSNARKVVDSARPSAVS